MNIQHISNLYKKENIFYIGKNSEFLIEILPPDDIYNAWFKNDKISNYKLAYTCSNLINTINYSNKTLQIIENRNQFNNQFFYFNFRNHNQCHKKVFDLKRLKKNDININIKHQKNGIWWNNKKYNGGLQLNNSGEFNIFILNNSEDFSETILYFSYSTKSLKLALDILNESFLFFF